MLLYKELSKEILDAFYEVYHDLGYGFLEKVYQNAIVRVCPSFYYVIKGCKK